MLINKMAKLGDIVDIPIDSQKFGRIATQNAKGVIVQKIREEERNSVYRYLYAYEHEIMTGVVQRILGKNISINLGKADAILAESEQVKGEVLKPNQRVKVYVLEVKNNTKGTRISVSRTHPDLMDFSVQNSPDWTFPALAAMPTIPYIFFFAISFKIKVIIPHLKPCSLSLHHTQLLHYNHHCTQFLRHLYIFPEHIRPL